MTAERAHLLEHGLDARVRVERDREQRQVFGERQQALGLQPVLDAKALDPAQQHARPDTVAGKDVHQRVGEQPPADVVTLAEIGGQPQPVLDHQPAPSSRPSAAAPTPSMRLSATFAHSSQRRPSSARRWDSSIQVENVV